MARPIAPVVVEPDDADLAALDGLLDGWAQRSEPGFDAAVAYLRSTHLLGTGCGRPDHLAEMTRFAERTTEAQLLAMDGLARSVIESMHLPTEQRDQGLAALDAGLERYRAESYP